MWFAQEDVDIRRQGELLMPSHLRSALAGQRAVQLFWQVQKASAHLGSKKPFEFSLAEQIPLFTCKRTAQRR
jgi:hypothetical protein